MADSKLKNTEGVKYKGISGCMSDCFGFTLCNDGTVYSAENVFCMICQKLSAYHGSNISLVKLKLMIEKLIVTSPIFYDF